MADIDAAQFREDFPEFSDVVAYPATQVDFWLGVAYLRLLARPWGDLRNMGVELFVAHNLTLERMNKKAATNGGAPGQNVGPLNNKSVDKVSAGYDTAAGAVEGGGNYNLTNYGTRFLELVDIVGVVGMAQIGTGPDSTAGIVVGG